jgi:Pentapeptide repeats (9 copies)
LLPVLGDDPAVSARSSWPDPLPPRPLSKWIIRVGTLVVLVVAVVSWSVLRRLYGGQGAQVQLDVIRTAGTLVIGTGGALALLLTARRQRYTELALVHTDRDATERRVTELYTKAADQLGSDKAPVRLAGLYALERLAHSNVEHRQTMVDVVCAYLRMPYTPPPNTSISLGSSGQKQVQQERQVRLTAQDILSRNLHVVAQRRRRRWHRTPPPAPAWPGTRLDLTGALLLEFLLAERQIDHPDFTRAQFIDNGLFWNAQFTGWAQFVGTQFNRGANFMDAQFAEVAYFGGAQFNDRTSFSDAQFPRWTDFMGARFNGWANFRGAQFGGVVDFERVQFSGKAYFEGARFSGKADFEGARVTPAAEPGSIWPPGWTTRPAQPDNGEDPAFQYLTRVEDGNPLDT